MPTRPQTRSGTSHVTQLFTEQVREKFERLKWKYRATIVMFKNNLNIRNNSCQAQKGTGHRQKKRTKVHSNNRCHHNDRVRPPCKLIIPKVVATSQHTGQPVLIKKPFAFSKSVVLKLQYRNQPVSQFLFPTSQSPGLWRFPTTMRVPLHPIHYQSRRLINGHMIRPIYCLHSVKSLVQGLLSA